MLLTTAPQVTVSLELGYPAQLASPAPGSRDNTTVELCDTSLCTGRDYSLDLEFDSSPEPSNLEWVIRWVPESSSGPGPTFNVSARASNECSHYHREGPD